MQNKLFSSFTPVRFIIVHTNNEVRVYTVQTTLVSGHNANLENTGVWSTASHVWKPSPAFWAGLSRTERNQNRSPGIKY